uniref:Gustatory receptor n=1 Tax=Lutzomyia longipalpis TaxID=7200 RepID=A0A7G3B6I0_LUTLO
MITFSSFFNLINTFFGISVASFNRNGNYFVKSTFKRIYTTVLLLITILFYPKMIKFFVNNFYDISKNPLSMLVCLLQTSSQYVLNVTLLLSKLIYCREEVTFKNNHLKFKKKLNDYILKNKKTKSGQNLLYFYFLINSVFIFLMQIYATTVVLVRVVRFHALGYIYIITYVFSYFQIITVGNMFFEKILQYYFAVSYINQALLDDLRILLGKIGCKSRSHCIISSCGISDNLDNLQRLNSQLYELVYEMIQYESLALIAVFLHKFIEILVPIFYQFIARTLYVDSSSNLSIYIVFGMCYPLWNVISMFLLINMCEKFQQEVNIKKYPNFFSKDLY